MIRKRWLIAFVLAGGACFGGSGPEPGAPLEAARHRAALASMTVDNETGLALEIAFCTAVPPLQETVIGRVAPHTRAAMAPVPAGEPLIMIARRADGAEFQGKVQSFPLDGAVIWNIPRTATFLLKEPAQ